jgi:poly(3-hydroxybutyrate) depolymerase
VVFVFHVTSGTDLGFYNGTDWKQKADEEGFIALFPSPLTYFFYDNVNVTISTKWVEGTVEDQDIFPLFSEAGVSMLSSHIQTLVNHPLADDLAFFDIMSAALKGQYAVDSRIFYLTGFSNGGQMVSRLAAERSTLFAAATANAGTLGSIIRLSRKSDYISS